jgi:hypothetical protein
MSFLDDVLAQRGQRKARHPEGDNPEGDADDCAAKEHTGNDVFAGNPKPCKDEPQDVSDRAGSPCSEMFGEASPNRPDSPC